MQFTRLKTIFFTVSILMLSACGGGGNKLSSPELGAGSSSSLRSASSVSSSSSVSANAKSSSSMAANCTNSVGDVFINSVCSGWRGVSVYERFTAVAAAREIGDGSPGDLVTQKIIASGVAGRDQVLDIQYNSRSPELNGIVRIFSPGAEGVDMSSYATGKLIFDVNLINEGDDQPNLEVVIECGWPCNTHSYKVKVAKLNSWQTFELSVKDLIAQGLDIEHVTTGILIVPTWNRQANVHFQLDNIRWIKGAPEVAKETVCFANHLDFNDWDNGKNTYSYGFGSFAGVAVFDYDTWLGQLVPEIAIRPQWDLVPGAWGFTITEPVVAATGQPIAFPDFKQCATQGTLSAQVYLPESYVADGEMKVGLFIVDSLGVAHVFASESLSAGAMKPNDWTTISVKLKNFPTIYDAVKVGVFFDPNGKLASVSGDIRIDNFVVSHSLP